MTGTLHEDHRTFLIISRYVLLTMRNVSDGFVEEIKTHFVVNNFFPPENRAVYELMRRNIAEPNRPQMTMWRMRIACWIPKSTVTHSECVIRIAFPLQLLHFRHAFCMSRHILSSPTLPLQSYLLKAAFLIVCVTNIRHLSVNVNPI
jgi:hypothetical protein